jgi:hypothetical protein
MFSAAIYKKNIHKILLNAKSEKYLFTSDRGSFAKTSTPIDDITIKQTAYNKEI